MAEEDGRPQKPSDNNLFKWMRFIDPNDPTKVMELKMVDTGETTPDGHKRYALGSVAVQPGGEAVYSEEDTLLRPFYDGGIADVGSEVVIAGSRGEMFVQMSEAAQIDNGEQDVHSLLEFSKAGRIRGEMSHSADGPGATLVITSFNRSFWNGTTTYTVRREEIDLDFTNREKINIDMPAMANWGSIVISNNQGFAFTYKINVEGVP